MTGNVTPLTTLTLPPRNTMTGVVPQFSFFPLSPHLLSFLCLRTLQWSNSDMQLIPTGGVADGGGWEKVKNGEMGYVTFR